MGQVLAGRYTAIADRDFVVFIIGMRVNKWWLIHKWFPVVLAMPKMLIKLMQNRSLGMLHGESFFRVFPVATTLISYWESFEHLERFAHDKTLPHAAEWAKFMRSVGSSGDVGIYHETFQVKQGAYETLYGNMPKFGLGAAFDSVPVGARTDTARGRIEKT